MTDQNPPAGAERYEWLGRNLGSITRTNPDTGNSYRVGFNMDDRFVWIAPEDLAWAQAQPESFQAAPLEVATDAGDAPAAKPASARGKKAAKPRDAADGVPEDGAAPSDAALAHAPIVDAEP